MNSASLETVRSHEKDELLEHPVDACVMGSTRDRTTVGVRLEVDAMAMGRRRPVQKRRFMRSDEPAEPPHHRSDETLDEFLDEPGFAAFVDALCAP